MKKLITVLIALSIAGNLALIAALFAGRVTAPAEVEAPVAATKPMAAPAKSGIDARTWETLKTDNLGTLVQRLRERGFPPAIIRGIVSAQLNEAYAARIKALDPNASNRPFWKSYTIDPKIQTAQRQLYREQQKALRELLGADAEPTENINALYQGRRFDSVPPEKVDDVQRLLRDFEDARQDLYSSAGGGIIGAEIQKRVEALEKDQHAALARVLTPEELEQWDLRNSNTARDVRYRLSAFNPTEEEYKAVYRLQAAFDEQFGRLYSSPPPEEMKRRSDAERQMQEQIKATLGPVRGADYERANDHYYRQTSQLVARLELPAEATNQVYDIQKDIQKRLSGSYGTGPTPPEERKQALAALEKEAQTRITAVLGTRGYDAYQQYGGMWMQSLRPRPPQPNPPGR